MKSVEIIKNLVSNQYLRNIGWLGSAELANRVFRLATTVVVARILTQYDYGLVAIVMTVYEIANIFTLRSGIGSKLIQAEDKDLDVLCNTAYWMNWILCISLFLIQCLIAIPVSLLYNESEIVWPICAIALCYLLIPTFAIQSALTFRENRLSVTAQCNFIQSFLSNVLTVIFAVLGMGMWSVVLPVVITMPVWTLINRRAHKWRVSKPFSLYRWREIAGFSTNILGVELLDKLRSNIDYLLVGRFLGVEALGLYFFAFNAGLGISLNVINTLTWSLLPHLCEVRNNWAEFNRRYLDSLKTMAKIMIPLVICQASLSPFYVPIVFGEKWIPAIPVLIVICLSAIPRPFGKAAGTLLQSVDKTRFDLLFNLGFTVFLIFALIMLVNHGIFIVAVTILIAHIVFLPLYSLLIYQKVFKKSELKAT